MSSQYPYPGLRPFKREETDIFFGREEHTDELLNCLERQHFLAVIGLSGCGKSSLVKTGLIPNLEAGYLSSAGTRWKIAEMRPENQPFANLAEVLIAALGDDYKAELENEVLKRGSFSLQELLVVKPLANQAKLLIVCDQFEEIFRYAEQSNSSEAAAFVALFLACAKPYLLPNGQLFDDIYVVVTMRSDYLGQCATFIGLAEAINSGLYLTPRLNREQLRLAIEEPALAFGGKIEPKLVVKLLEDAENNQDQLPLLQHLLMRLWDIKTRDNIPLRDVISDSEKQAIKPLIITLADYQGDEKIQTLKNALSAHADEAFNELTEIQKLIAQQIFCRLTGAETGKNDTRNPTKVKELLALTGQNLEQLAEVLKPFRQAGCCFLLPSEEVALAEETVIDITHESLIRNWERLDKWTQDEAQAAQTYRHLLEGALRYRNKQVGLLQEPELSLMLQWRKSFQPTSAWAMRYGKYEEDFPKALAFLAESEKWQKVRKTLYVAGFIAMTGLAGFATWEWQQTSKHKLKAEQKTLEAEKTKQQSQIQLFQSRVTHASLLAKGEDYLTAKKVLNETDVLDKEATPAMLHSRNLLRSFTHIMGGESDQVYQGAGDALLTTAISPDGLLLAAGGERGTLVIFDAITGHLLQRLEGHDMQDVRKIAFTPQGDYLISAGHDHKIIFWQRQGRHFKQQRILQSPGKVGAIAITPNGKMLATGSIAILKLWEVPSGKLINTIYIPESPECFAFSADGGYLAGGSYDMAFIVRLKDKGIGILKGHGSTVRQVAFSADGKSLATASGDKSVRIWDVEKGELIRKLDGHTNMVFAVQFIGNGDTLVSAGFDRTIRLWDSQRGVTLRVLQGHEAGITSFALYGDKLFTASNDGSLRRWQLTLPYQENIPLLSDPFSNAITPDLQKVGVGFSDGTLGLYSVENGTMLWKQKKAHSDTVGRLSFNNEGNLLASPSEDHTVKIWQLNSPIAPLKELQTFSRHKDSVPAVSFSPDGHTLATAGFDGQIGLFKVGAQEKPRMIEKAHNVRVGSVTFSKSGEQLLSSGEDGLIKLWDIKTMKPRTLAKVDDIVVWSSWSPDNQWFVTVGLKQSVDVFDTASRTLKYHLTGHDQSVDKAIFYQIVSN